MKSKKIDQNSINKKKRLTIKMVGRTKL